MTRINPITQQAFAKNGQTNSFNPGTFMSLVSDIEANGIHQEVITVSSIKKQVHMEIKSDKAKQRRAAYRPIALAVALLGLGLQAADALATTYYINGSTGSDSNAGTSNGAPWKTLAKATQTLRAGDTVLIHAGTYNEKLWPQWGGNATDGYITYAAYGDGNVIINPKNNVPAWTGAFYIPDSNSVGYVRDVNYIKLKGLDFTGTTSSYGAAIYAADGKNGSNVVFENLKLYGNQTGAMIEGAYFTMTDTVAYNNSFTGVQFFKPAHHGRVSRSKFYNNTSPGCNCDGLIIVDVDYLLVEDSEAYGNYDGFDTGSQYNPPYPADAGSKHIIFRRVISHDNVNTNFPLSTILTGPVTYENIVTYNNYNWGSMVNYEKSKNVHIWNSVFDNVATGILLTDSPGPMSYYNNIFNASTAISNASGGIISADNNRLMQGVYSGVTPGPNSSTGTVNFVNAAGRDYHLTANNPALIDKGAFFMRTSQAGSGTTVINVNKDPTIFFWVGDTIQIEGVGTRVVKSMSGTSITVDAPMTYSAGAGVHLPWSGAAPDIGAFEYSAGGLTPPTNLRFTQ